MKEANETTHSCIKAVMDAIDRKHGRTGHYAHTQVCHYGMSTALWLPEWSELNRVVDRSETDSECQAGLLLLMASLESE